MLKSFFNYYVCRDLLRKRYKSGEHVNADPDHPTRGEQTETAGGRKVSSVKSSPHNAREGGAVDRISHQSASSAPGLEDIPMKINLGSHGEAAGV